MKSPNECSTIDVAAKKAGLRPLRAWVPDSAERSRSPEATRQKKHRDKYAKDGLKQLSVVLPLEVHASIKEIALKTRNGVTLAEVLRELLPLSESDISQTTPSSPASVLSLASFESLSSWRRWLIAKIARA